MKQALVFLLAIFAMCITSCGPALLTPSPVPSPSPLPTLLPTCLPTAGDFYSNNEGTNKQATVLADKIYGSLFIPALGRNDIAGMNNAKSQALQFFTYEVKRWTSASQEISFSDGSKARIFVTFISPQLIRAAALTHAMLGDIEGHNLNAYTARGLKRLDRRNEYLFLVTVQSDAAANSPEQIVFPTDLFALKGTAGLPIRHIRHDHFLATPMLLSQGHLASFVYFPLAQQVGEKCSPVLDEERDSYLILTMPYVQIGNQRQNLVFEIPFISPALFDNETIPTPVPNLSLATKEFTPSNELAPLAAYSTNPEEFWKKFTRFVWKKLTFDGLASE